jgi:hypothetical protein
MTKELGRKVGLLFLPAVERNETLPLELATDYRVRFRRILTMRASLVRFGGAFLLCAMGCGSATLSQDAGTGAAAGTTGHTGGSGGHGSGGAGTASGGGSGSQAGAGGTSSGGTGGTLGAGGTSSQGGAGGNNMGGNGGTSGNAATGGSGPAGTSGTGGQGAGGTAGHGAGGAGAAGTSGSGGTSGVGGTTTCANTTTDTLNCGSCGHSCLGGACLEGICQPLLLGTVPLTDFAEETVVLDGKVYVFSDSSQTGNRTDVWEVDASTPGTPTEVTTNGQASCILNGQLFWSTYNNPYQMFSCTFSNCAATATPIVTLASGASFGNQLRCDPTNDEVVWMATTDGSDFTINRASPTGANARVITSLEFLNDGASWGFLDPGTQADRFFYARTETTVLPSGTSVSASLYYITTDVVNAAGILIVTNPNGGIGDVLANDAVVLVSGGASSDAPQELSVPLPNGILSGVPPVFAPGSIVSYGGVIDQTTFYGTIGSDSAVPSDAVVECSLSGCATPTILFRGQASPFAFAADATAIYWTTNAFSQTQGFSIWKAAK